MGVSGAQSGVITSAAATLPGVAAVFARSGRQQRGVRPARARTAAAAKSGCGAADASFSGRTQSNRAITSPLRIFGSNQVDFGGMNRPCSQTSMNCCIVTGASESANS